MCTYDTDSSYTVKSITLVLYTQEGQALYWANFLKYSSLNSRVLNLLLLLLAMRFTPLNLA